MKETKWFLYDGRYHTDPDRAVCHGVCDSLKEAVREAPTYGDNVAIVLTTIENGVVISQKTIKPVRS